MSTTEDTKTPGQEEPVTILYTNWRHKTGPRVIVPGGDDPESPNPWFGASEWHPEPQYLLSAWDVEKGVFRDFALSGIKAWGQAAVDAALASASPRADSDERTAGCSKWGPNFPPTTCNAFEDCASDGICHDFDQCQIKGPAEDEEDSPALATPRADSAEMTAGEGSAWPDNSPNPTPEELASPQFEAVWQLIKSWDIGIPEEYGGYCGATGSHVVRILRALPAPSSPGVPDSVRADAARWNFTQQAGYFQTGPYNNYGDWCGYKVGLQKTPQTSINHSIMGQGKTLKEAIDAALSTHPAGQSTGQGAEPSPTAEACRQAARRAAEQLSWSSKPAPPSSGQEP